MDSSDRFGAADDLCSGPAIDRGIRASRRGEVVPLSTVREWIPLWVAKYAGGRR
jgi:predicted transcriptional regulator